MIRIVSIFITVLLMGFSAAYADADTGAIRLHTQCPKYDGYTAASGDFIRPIRSLTVKFEGDVAYESVVKDNRLHLKTMAPAERRRVRALLNKFIRMYLPVYAAARDDGKSEYELVIVCDPKVGLDVDGTVKRVSDAPLNETGIPMKDKYHVYPVVRGWYYLVNKKNKTVLLHNELTGAGSAIDTAIDDFARKLIVDLAPQISDR